MPNQILHLKVSTVPDNANPEEIQPSDWNAEHQVIIDFNDPANVGLGAALVNGGIDARMLDTTIPAAPAGVTVEGAFEAVKVSWTAPAEVYIEGAEIWRNSSNTISGAVKVAESKANFYVVPATTSAYYFVRFISYSKRLGAFSAGVQAAPENSTEHIKEVLAGALDVAQFASGIEPVGIVTSLPNPIGYFGPKVVLFNGEIYRLFGTQWSKQVNAVDMIGQIVQAQIADAAITTAKFAAGIEPVRVVNALPSPVAYTGAKTVFLTTDNKIYRHTGSAWVTGVSSTDITGTIANAQIEALAASKITGQLTSDQIADIAAAKIAGQLSDSQLAAISAAKITGQIIASQIAAGAVDASKLNIEIGGGNLLSNSSFELDSNADGLADGWLAYTSGTTGTVTSALDTSKVMHGTKSQRRSATGLGTTTTDRVGINATFLPPGVAGKSFTLSAYIAATGNAKVRIYADWRNSGGTVVGSFSSTPTTSDGTLARHVITGVAPATAVSVNVLAWAQERPTVGAVDFFVDGIQLELSNIVSAYAPRPDEILDGSITATQIADNAITTPKLVAGAVVAGKIAANAISATEIQSGAITTAKLAAGAVTANEIAASTITGAKIAADTITASNIAAGTITAAEMAAGSVTATQLAAGAVTAGKIAAGAIVAADIASGTITATQLAAGSVTTAKLAAGAVTANEIAAATITGAKIAANTITASNIAADTITAGQIAAGAIGADEIAANAITAAKIAAGTITATQIAAGTLTAATLAAGSVSTDKLATNAVTSDKIAANSIIAGKIAAGAISASEIAAGAITTSKLAIVNSAAINDSPNFDDLTAWNLSAGLTQAFGAGGSAVAPSYVQCTGPVDQKAISIRNFPIDPAKVYSLTAMLYAAAGNNRNMYVFLDFYTGTGAAIGSTSWGGAHNGYVFGGLPTPGDWQRVGAQFGPGTGREIPSSAKQCRIGVWFQYSGAGSGLVQQAAQDIRLIEAVGASLIVDGSVTASKIAALSVTAGKIAAGAVTANEIAANTITAAKIAAGTITGTEIAGSTITGGKIAANTISAANLVIGTITGDRIAAGTITASLLAANTITASQIAVGGGILNAEQQWNQVLNRPADDAIKNNLIDLSVWRKGAAVPWATNGEANAFFPCAPSGTPDLPNAVAGPRGGNDIVWYCQEQTNDGNSGGGWNAPSVQLDPTKIYRFAVPIRRYGSTTPGGQAYWGCTTVCDLNTTNENSNPYFAVLSRAQMQTDRWYLFVGYIFPYGSTANTHESSGIWDCKTGVKVGGGSNYNHRATGLVGHRAYQFYAESGAQQLFGRPMINLVDGTEPSLREYFEQTAVLNQSAYDKFDTVGVNISGSGVRVRSVSTGAIFFDASASSPPWVVSLASTGTGSGTEVSLAAEASANNTAGLKSLKQGPGISLSDQGTAVLISTQASEVYNACRTTDFAINTAYQNPNGFGTTLEASSSYLFEATLAIFPGNTGIGIHVAMNLASDQVGYFHTEMVTSTNGMYADIQKVTGNGTDQAIFLPSSSASPSEEIIVHVKGVLRTGASGAGTAKLMLKCSSSSISMRAGSGLKFSKLSAPPAVSTTIAATPWGTAASYTRNTLSPSSNGSGAVTFIVKADGRNFVIQGASSAVGTGWATGAPLSELGGDCEVQFVQGSQSTTSNSTSYITNGAPSYSPLNADRSFTLTVTTSESSGFYGQGSVSITINIRKIGTTTPVSRTLTLSVMNEVNWNDN